MYLQLCGPAVKFSLFCISAVEFVCACPGSIQHVRILLGFVFVCSHLVWCVRCYCRSVRD